MLYYTELAVDIFFHESATTDICTYSHTLPLLVVLTSSASSGTSAAKLSRRRRVRPPTRRSASPRSGLATALTAPPPARSIPGSAHIGAHRCNRRRYRGGTPGTAPPSARRSHSSAGNRQWSRAARDRAAAPRHRDRKSTRQNSSDSTAYRM